LAAALAVTLHAADRPKIVGIANIAVKVDSLDEARKFYTGVVGMAEAFSTKDPDVAGDLACFKVNDRQFVEVSPTLKDDAEDRLIRIGFETTDARALRDYLASKGIAVPARVDSDANGNRSFVVRDPDGHAVQFVQYMPGSVHSRDVGKHLSATRVSDHMLHVGVWVVDPAKADAFYKDVLGFRPQWKGGRSDDRFEWISLMVPDGYDWVEYMVSSLACCITTRSNPWISSPSTRPSSSAVTSRRRSPTSPAMADGCCNSTTRTIRALR
jgi:lactoylglutathione lyase